jgi:hypothetical protein
MSNWQDALSSVRCDCIQASILPPPGFTPAQIFLTSPRHAFPIAAALTKMVWHVGVRSFKCELMQALMRPAPGCTPLHCALTSAAHSFGAAAIVLVVESKRMEPNTQIFFSISLSPIFLPSQIELGQRRATTSSIASPQTYSNHLPAQSKRVSWTCIQSVPRISRRMSAFKGKADMTFCAANVCLTQSGHAARASPRSSTEP